MNDEELRAFLDSATVDGEEDQDQAPETQEPQAAEQPASPQTPRRGGVPSFDELMHMGAETAAPVASAAQPATEAAEPAQPASADAEPQAVDSSDDAATSSGAQQWSQAYAEDEEQLVPLILPGFSPEPRQRRDLPPVFQAEPSAPMQPEPTSSGYDEPAPTQPFDVLSEDATISGSGSGSGSTKAASAVTAAVASATAPLATGASRSDEGPADSDPLAFLAPELASSSRQQEQDEYERISVTGTEHRGRKALPWLIVGGGVVVAIIASIFVINGVRGAEAPAPEPAPVVTTDPTTPEPTTPEETDPTPEKPAPEPSTAPVIDPGTTFTLRIDQWEIGVQVSEKIGGNTPYTLFDGNSRAMFDSLPIAAGFSDACEAARQPHAWGLLKKDDGTLEVVRPQPRCADKADAAIYDTIWGVLDHMAKTAKAS